jgi:sugar lactone lactonase YvrE
LSGSGGQVEPRADPDRRAELQAIFADERRFRPWYDVAARRVYAYLFGRCGGDAGLAEELTQLTFIDALRHRDSYDGRAELNFDPEGNLYVFNCIGGRIQVFDPEHRLIGLWDGPDYEHRQAFAFAPDGRMYQLGPDNTIVEIRIDLP